MSPGGNPQAKVLVGVAIHLKILITILIVLVIALVLVLVFGAVIQRNLEEPPTNRKWTDPKFHD